jgi:hypothetical protein
MQPLNIGPIVVINPSSRGVADFAIGIAQCPIAVVNTQSDTRSAGAASLRNRMASYGVTPRRIAGASTAIAGIIGLGASTIIATSTFLELRFGDKNHNNSSGNKIKFSTATYGAVVSLATIGAGIAVIAMPTHIPFQPPVPETITPTQPAPMYGVVIESNEDTLIEDSPVTSRDS